MSEEMDWREMRARLVAQESPASDTAGGSSYVYESPLIEKGSILLGGTKQAFGFALRQQFFHKSVMLLLQHDDGFTKGIILNRPSALELDGWRVWCGHGQVAEGGMFVGPENARGQLEINALHSLDGFLADRLSTKVIKGVSVTSLDGAKALVAAGTAKKADFWVCVGYSGWAPGQLAAEVEQRDSWYLASADSGTLLTELLRQAREPSAGAAVADNGISTWSRLMSGIGRNADVRQSEGSLADRMLTEWVRAHLLPRKPMTDVARAALSVGEGAVLCSTVAAESGRPADRFLLQDQFLHKAVLLVLTAGDEGEAGLVRACILNRPTANVVRFNTPGNPRRLVPFCGNRKIVDEVWLHHRSALGGQPVGDSGIFRLPAAEAAAKLMAGDAMASDFLLVGGVVEFRRDELSSYLAAGEMRVLPPGDELAGVWPRVWSLTSEEGDGISDGTDLWWVASQCGSEQLTAGAPSSLADDALEEWLKWFARASD